MGSHSLADDTTAIQHFALWSARLLAFLAFVCIYIWAAGENTSQGYNGGLVNWQSDNIDKIFNWHPICMMLGMMFLGGWGVTAFRLPYLTKEQNKIIHQICHVGAVISWGIGLATVYRVNFQEIKDEQGNPTGTYPQTLNSIHAIVGMMTCIIYFVNFTMGALAYGLGVVDLETKKALMPWHIFLGTYALMAALAAIISGIQRFMDTCNINDPKFYSADQNVNGHDWNPAHWYPEMNDGCKLLLGGGIMTWMAMGLIVLGISRNFVTAAPQEKQNLNIEI